MFGVAGVTGVAGVAGAAGAGAATVVGAVGSAAGGAEGSGATIVSGFGFFLKKLNIGSQGRKAMQRRCGQGYTIKRILSEQRL
jgi:hypothetical protein